MLAIHGSVGSNGDNKSEDVKIVQALLNKNLMPPLRLLDITGNCDDSTLFAIAEFQRRYVKMPSPDGRVDPGGKTFRTLSGQLAPPSKRPAIVIGQIATSVAKPAIMRQTAWDYLLAFTAHHEFPVFNMYNNRATEAAKQDVTCGIGFLLENRETPTRVDIMQMFFDPATKATPTADQLRADWDAASQLLRTGSNLDDYGGVCHMRMYPDKVYEKMAKILRDDKLPVLLKMRDYAGFKDMPAAAQAFCVSFAYGRIPFDFPTMNGFIKAGQYDKASRECRLTGASAAKNKAHANLLMFAQRIIDTNGNLDTIPTGFDGN